MIRAAHSPKPIGDRTRTTPSGQLPYTVELWNLSRTAPERVIARAASITLARAIFVAAQTEHLDRRILLRRGRQVLERTD